MLSAVGCHRGMLFSVHASLDSLAIHLNQHTFCNGDRHGTCIYSYQFIRTYVNPEDQNSTAKSIDEQPVYVHWSQHMPSTCLRWSGSPDTKYGTNDALRSHKLRLALCVVRKGQLF